MLYRIVSQFSTTQDIHFCQRKVFFVHDPAQRNVIMIMLWSKTSVAYGTVEPHKEIFA